MIFLKQIYRQILKKKGIAATGAGGLTLSIAAVIVIFQFLFFELSFDKFHTDTNRIYRVDRSMLHDIGEVPSKAGSSSSRMEGEILKSNITGVENVLRLHPLYGDAIVNTGMTSFNETNLFYSDPDFFSFFSFKCLYGNSGEALSNPNMAAISRSASEKIFHTPNSVNKTFDVYDRYLGKKTYTVAAVFDDLPPNTHLKINMLFPIADLLKHEQYVTDPWKWANFRTYVKLIPDAGSKYVEAQLDQYALSEKIAEKFGYYKTSYQLHALSSIHMSGTKDRYETNTRPLNVYLILFAGILVVAVACLNYLNLSLARISDDKKKMELKKALGAEWRQFFIEIVAEPVLIYSCSFVMAITLYLSLIGVMKSQFGWNIQLSFSQQAMILGYILVLFLGLAVLTGFLLSLKGIRNNVPARIIKTGKTTDLPANLLTTFQFVGAIALICFTVLAMKQIDYMTGIELGFSKENVLIVKSPRLSDEQQDINTLRSAFSNEALNIPGIKAITSSTYIPGMFISSIQTIQFENGTANYEIASRMNWIESSYFPVYENRFVAGRNFSENEGLEDNSFIINRKLSQELGFASTEDAIGKRVYWKQGNKMKQIVGVVDNYYQESPEMDTYPIAFHYSANATGYYSVKIATGSRPDIVIGKLEKLWDKVHSGNPFDYSWLDKGYNAQYDQWIRMKSIFMAFSLLAILISAMGLVAQIGLRLSRRTKEIGIRKVNGARISEVLIMLNRDFVKWVAIAFVIATPLAWYAMHKWLQNFACKTELSWWIFALAGLLALGIALLTVSWQSWRAATRNPVEALRYE